MSRAYLGTATIALVALLGFPRAGNAGIIDFIWEMSGPQMFSVLTFQCEYDLSGTRKGECRIYEKRVSGNSPRAERKVWLTLGAAAYTSTGRDSDVRQYDAFKNHMLAFEPMIEFHSTTRVRHGVGLSYDYVFGSKLRGFDKLGLKFEPVAVPLGSSNWEVAANIRLYPNGFTVDEFGQEPRLFDLDRGREWLYGFSVGWRSPL